MSRYINVFNSACGMFFFIISIVSWLFSYMELRASKNWKPKFCRMGQIHWTILVSK